MLKKVMVFSLMTVIAIAVGVSALNVFASQADGVENAAVSSAPVNDLVAGAGAQAGSRGGKTDTGGGSWQSQTPTQGGQGGRYGQGGNGQGGNGQGGRGQGQGAGNGAGTNSGIPSPQAAQNEIVTLQGVVSTYAAPNLTLLTDDGQTVFAQMGNQRFVSDLGIELQAGAAVTLVGFFETSDTFAIISLTLDADGTTYTLRDQGTGRPMWAGGPKNH
jgi:hypothetical protein